MSKLCVCLVAQSCPNSLWSPGLYPAKVLSLWDSADKITGVGCHFLLQGIFPTQRSNLGLLLCRQMLYCLSHQGSLTSSCQPSSSCFIWGAWEWLVQTHTRSWHQSWTRLLIPFHATYLPFYHWFRFNLIPLPGTLIPVRARRPGLPTTPSGGILEMPSSAPLSPCSLWLTHPHHLLSAPWTTFPRAGNNALKPLIATGAWSRSEDGLGEQGKQTQVLQGCGGPKFAWIWKVCFPQNLSCSEKEVTLCCSAFLSLETISQNWESLPTALTYTLEKILMLERLRAREEGDNRGWDG